LPPWPAKAGQISKFLDFFEENSIFLLYFWQKEGSRPVENFCPPLEKSLRTPMGPSYFKNNFEGRQPKKFQNPFLKVFDRDEYKVNNVFLA
jgi:hypothetical protein